MFRKYRFRLGVLLIAAVLGAMLATSADARRVKGAATGAAIGAGVGAIVDGGRGIGRGAGIGAIMGALFVR